jgi:hypothetical protein
VVVTLGSDYSPLWEVEARLRRGGYAGCGMGNGQMWVGADYRTVVSFRFRGAMDPVLGN